MSLFLYRTFSFLIQPFMGVWLRLRMRRGKEDAARLRERLGYAAIPRPEGKLLWLHGASVGESVSIIPLLARITETYPALNILVTTGTVTAAAIMAARMPARCIHQYIPVDTQAAVRRFLKHWQPELGLVVESELWPNLILTAKAQGCTLVQVNGRMSPRAFATWQKHRGLARKMLECFSLCLAQSEEDGERFRQLGMPDVQCVGNLKFDAPPPPADPVKVGQLVNMIGTHPVWAAASTHPGEEQQLAEAHLRLRAVHPDLLLILIPRHPARGAELKTMIEANFPGVGLVVLRSTGEAITTQTGVYIADTMGEMGIFYRVAGIVFMGGSLVKHGGQNPLEPARLECAILTGPHTHNFTRAYAELTAAGCAITVASAEELAAGIGELLAAPARQREIAIRTREFMETRIGELERFLQALAPFLSNVSV